MNSPPTSASFGINDRSRKGATQKSSQQTTEEGTSLDGVDVQSRTWTHIYLTNSDLTHHRIDGVSPACVAIPAFHPHHLIALLMANTSLINN